LYVVFDGFTVDHSGHPVLNTGVGVILQFGPT
jgi:hypothetical protein